MVDYAVNDDVMIYANAAKGYKGEGFNGSAIDSNGDFIGDTAASFDPESNLAYELGLKSTLNDGRLRLYGAVFLNDYEDLHIAASTLAGIGVDNAAEAETKGIELEVVYLPIEDLTLTANYSYLDSEFTRGENAGNVLAYAPENSFYFAANYEHQFSGGNLNWFGSYSYQDDTFFRADNIFRQDSYGILGAKVTYTSTSQKWDVALAGNNLTDEDYLIASFDIGLGDTVAHGMPRLWSVIFNAYF